MSAEDRAAKVIERTLEDWDEHDLDLVTQKVLIALGSEGLVVVAREDRLTAEDVAEALRWADQVKHDLSGLNEVGHTLEAKLRRLSGGD